MERKCLHVLFFHTITKSATISAHIHTHTYICYIYVILISLDFLKGLFVYIFSFFSLIITTIIIRFLIGSCANGLLYFQIDQDSTKGAESGQMVINAKTADSFGFLCCHLKLILQYFQYLMQFLFALFCQPQSSLSPDDRRSCDKLCTEHLEKNTF